jgi:iron complex outermembrane recepter protein
MIKFLPTFTLFLFLLFATTNLYAQRTITGTVTSAGDKKSLPEAIVLLKGSNIGVVANEDGTFSINVPSNTGKLIFTYIGFLAKEVDITTAPDVLNIALEEGVELNNVTVVGTRNASRTRIESAVPVDIIPVRAVVNEVGQVDINQLLHYAAPSFNTTRQNVEDGGDHIDPASLRGLGTDQILVLINGKRRHTSAFINVIGTPSRGQASTDMSAIPAYAIDRIEILRDGASAQYGSDAIAGVINIVLRKDANRLFAAVNTGVYKAGDGLTGNLSLNYGIKLGKKGYLNLTGEYKTRNSTNRTGDWSGPVYNAPYLADGSLPDTTRNEEWNYNNSKDPATGKTYKQLDDEELARRGTTRSTYRYVIGQSQQESGGIMFNASYPINDNVEVYSFGGFNQKRGSAAGYYRLPLEGRNVPEVYKDGFLPKILSTLTDYSGALGVRGKMGNWNYDLSNVYGANTFRYGVGNSLNASREQYRLLTPSAGLSPKTEFDAGTVGFHQNTTNIDFSHHNDNLFQGTNFAFGGEYRTDRYTQVKGEEDSYKTYSKLDTAGMELINKSGGSQIFPGFRTAVDRSRSNIALYGDMEADFTSNLMMGIALRYENYSDFGFTQNYKLIGKYKFTKQFMLRAAASTGFRAPSVHQLFYNATSTSATSGSSVFYELGIFTNDSEAAKILRIPKLKEETSINYSGGFAFKPNEAFELTLDGYLIDIQNRIVLTGEFNDKNLSPELVAELAKVNAQSAAFFTNAVDTRTMGLDLVTSYHLKAAKHDFRFVLAANYNKNTVVGNIKTSDSLRGRENVYFNRENRSHIEASAPNLKATFSINWKYNKMWAMLRNVYFGSITYIYPAASAEDAVAYNYNSDKIESLDQVFSPKTVTDLTVGYQVAKGFNVSIGASNMFDIYPDKTTSSYNSYYNQFPYSVYVQQFGFSGAYYFARLTYDLRTNTK